MPSEIGNDTSVADLVQDGTVPHIAEAVYDCSKDRITDREGFSVGGYATFPISQSRATDCLYRDDSDVPF